MIDKNGQDIAGGCLDLEHRAIPAEDAVAVLAVVDVTANGLDVVAAARHDRHVDPALVIAVDQHHVLIGIAIDRRHDILAEAQQGRTVFGLDDTEDVGIHISDDLGGQAGCRFVDRFIFEIDPTDPVVAAVGDDIDGSVLAAGQQVAVILPQNDPLAAVVRLGDPEVLHELDYLLLVGGGINRLAKNGVQFGVHLEDVLAGLPCGLIQGAGALEKVLHVIGRELHDPLQMIHPSALNHATTLG